MPNLPHRPTKKLPKPFSRPSVDLSRSGRVWRHVSPLSLAAGDVIPGVGLIQYVDFGTMTFVRGVAGNEVWLSNDSEVLAFVKRVD